MNTIGTVVVGVGGLLMLYFGADGLVKGGSALAARLKVPPLIVGLTLVAFGTSAPELFVSTNAAVQGLGDVCVGNVVGSNICNVALILGLSALVAPLEVGRALLRRDIPVMIVASVLATAVCLGGAGMGRCAGLAFVGILVAYTWLGFLTSRPNSAVPSPDEAGEMPTGVAVAVSFLGLAALVVGAKFVLIGAVSMAHAMGVSDGLVSLTVVAVGTSLPELATSVVAARDGEPDIAIGNLVGSNIFNIFGILGVSALVKPFSSPGIDAVDYAFMIGTAAILLPLALVRRRFGRREGLLLLVIYAAYLVHLVMNGVALTTC